MNDHTSEGWLQECLTHEDFVRRLARRLVRDEEQAEDLVQDTWVRTLEKPPTTPRTPRQWLATVLRNRARDLHRMDGRRKHREEVAARYEGARDEPDTGPRHELSEALGELSDIYQSVVRLHFLEGLSLDRVAERLGVPIETVKSRSKRAQKKLRDSLTRRYGGEREAWLSAFTLLGWPEGRPAADLPRAARVAPAASRAVPGLLVALPLIGLAVIAGVASLGGGDRAGALAGVESEPAHARSGAEGHDAASDSGRVSLASTAVPSGEAADAATAAPTTREVRGVVRLPDGGTARDAELYLSDPRPAWGAAPRALGRTDRRGRFRLTDVPADGWLGARRADFGPSALVSLGSANFVGERRVELELALTTPGLAARGRVESASGAGVSGAEVVHLPGYTELVGSARYSRDGRRERAPRDYLRTTTGGGGAFELPALSTDHNPVVLWASAPGHGARVVQVPRGSREALTIELRPETVVGGRVLLAGAPVPAAALRVTVDGVALPVVHVAGADGSYEVRGLPRGEEVVLHAWSDEAGTRGAARLVLSPEELRGPAATVDVELGTTSRVSGRLVDTAGEPLAGHRVELLLDLEEEWHGADALLPAQLLRTQTTGADGGFAFFGCPAERLRLLARAAPDEPPAAWRRGVFPGGDDVTLRAVDAAVGGGHLRLRMLASKGARGASGELVVDVPHRREPLRATAQERTGEVVLGPLPPGRYEPQLWFAGSPPVRLAPVRIAGEDVDLGVHRAPERGALIVNVRAPGRGDPPPHRVRAEHLDGGFVVQAAEPGAEGEGVTRLAPSSVKLEDLPPGRYAVTLRAGRDWAVTHRVVEVRSGAPSSVDLDLVRGAQRAVRVVARGDVREWTELSLRFVDERGDPVHPPLRRRLQYGAPWELTRRLPEGAWTLEVRCQDGRAARAACTVGGTGGSGTLEVVLAD